MLSISNPRKSLFFDNANQIYIFYFYQNFYNSYPKIPVDDPSLFSVGLKFWIFICNGRINP
mgnify:CR=1 FL=1